MRDTVRMLIASMAAAILFLFLFLFLHWNLVFCILSSVGMYFGLFFLLKPCRKIAGFAVEALSGGEELSRLLNEAQKDLEHLNQASQAIVVPTVRADARALYDTGVRIFSYLQENPAKIKQARSFFTYYLDTAAKLLTRYVEFQNTGLQSDEVTEILQKTAEALPVLNNAFEQQFTHMMEGELLDAEVDIELLKSIMKNGEW